MQMNGKSVCRSQTIAQDLLSETGEGKDFLIMKLMSTKQKTNT